MNRLTRFLFALWLVTGGIAGSPKPVAADVPVTLRSGAEVHRMAVRLSDVFAGVPAEADRDIAQSPYPGKQVTYDINVLTRLAQKYHLAWKSTSLADHIVVTTGISQITADMIRDSIAAKLKEMNVTAPGNTIDVVLDGHNTEMTFPDGRTPDFVLNNFDYDTATKRFHGEVQAHSENGAFTLPVMGHAAIKRNVPVLSHRLETGTIIGLMDIDTMLVPEERTTGNVVTDATQLVGRELRHDINGGEMIHTQDVIPQRFVTRGSLVTLKVQTPFMTVTAQGKAMQDGGKGDAIRVLNTQSNRTVEGVVEAPGIVRIEINQKMAAAQ